jgi:hypothetical protein
MKKDEAELGKNMTLARIYITKEADAGFGRMASIEGRTKARQMGITLERINQLFRDEPQKLQELGILSPMAAAVAAA